MRRVLIVVGVLGVVLAIAFAVAFRNLDTYLTENREEVASQVSAQLGRTVAFESVTLSWVGGLGVRVDDLRVGEDPAFGDEDFLTADAVDVRVKLLPALFGRVEVGRVVLRAPRLQVIQTRAGLSTDSLGQTSGGDEAAASEAEPSGATPALVIALLDMRDGALLFVDRSVKPPVTLAVEQLDVQASDISLDDPVSFEMEAALFGAERPNLFVSGTAGPPGESSAPFDVELELRAVDVDAVRRAPGVRDALPEDAAASGPVSLEARAEGELDALRFDAELDASDAAIRASGIDKPPGTRLVVSAKGTRDAEKVALSELRVGMGDTTLAGPVEVRLAETTRIVFDLGSERLEPAALGLGSEHAVLRDLGFAGDVALAEAGPRGSARVRSPAGSVRGGDYTNLEADLTLGGRRHELTRLSVAAFGGSIEATADVELRDAGGPRFGFDAKLAGMRAESLVRMATDSESDLLDGVVAAELALRGAGSGGDEILASLTGQGRLDVTEGVLKDFNPGGDALRALGPLVVLAAPGIKKVLDEHRGALREGDTPIEEMKSRFDVRGGQVHVSELVLRTPSYRVDGTGRYRIGGELDFDTRIAFESDVSRSLLSAAGDLRLLRGAGGLVNLPVKVRGTPPDLIVLPDVARLGTNAVREGLLGVVGGALGVGATAPDGEAPARGVVSGTAQGLGNLVGDVLGAPRQPEAPPPEPAPAAVPTPEAAPVPGATPEPDPEPATPEELGGELLRRGLGELLGN